MKKKFFVSLDSIPEWLELLFRSCEVTPEKEKQIVEVGCFRCSAECCIRRFGVSFVDCSSFFRSSFLFSRGERKSERVKRLGRLISFRSLRWVCVTYHSKSMFHFPSARLWCIWKYIGSIVNSVNSCQCINLYSVYVVVIFSAVVNMVIHLIGSIWGLWC